MNDKSKTEFLPFGTSVSSPPKQGSDSRKRFPEKRSRSTVRQRTIVSNQKMHKMLSPHKYRPSARPLEARFTMRSLGRSSYNSLSIEDVVEGKNIFRAGLSQMPDSIFEKFYVAKLAARDTILSRISSSIREADALGKMQDAVMEYEKCNRDLLASSSEELEFYKVEMNKRDSDIEKRNAHGQADYADDIAALTAVNTQLQFVFNPPSDPDPPDDSDSNASDDLVYEDDDEDDDDGVDSRHGNA